MTGLPYAEKNYDNMLSRFDRIPERAGQTDGRTERQNCYKISIARQCADKNWGPGQYLGLRSRTPVAYDFLIMPIAPKFMPHVFCDTAILCFFRVK